MIAVRNDLLLLPQFSQLVEIFSIVVSTTHFKPELEAQVGVAFLRLERTVAVVVADVDFSFVVLSLFDGDSEQRSILPRVLQWDSLLALLESRCNVSPCEGILEKED